MVDPQSNARQVHNIPSYYARQNNRHDFLTDYESRHRPTHGPLDPAAVAGVESFSRCGDLASGFTRLQCPGCGHAKLVAFTCKGRNFCPSCHHSSLPCRKLRMAGH